MNIKRALLALTLALGLVMVVVMVMDGNRTSVRAATYTVITMSATGPGSLNQAILDANGNSGHDTIDFGVTGTITLTIALPTIADDLTIDGPGADHLAISGADSYRIFAINSSTAVTITGVTLRDGSADNGGGIWSAGDLYLDAVHVTGNSASYDGGGVYVSVGSAVLSGTHVTGNSASDDGGGVFVYQGSATLDVSGGRDRRQLGIRQWRRGVRPRGQRDVERHAGFEQLGIRWRRGIRLSGQRDAERHARDR